MEALKEYHNNMIDLCDVVEKITQAVSSIEHRLTKLELENLKSNKNKDENVEEGMSDVA